MNSITATPPHKENRRITINLRYDPVTFREIIAKMSPDQVFDVSVEVWAEGHGLSMEILRSNLCDDIFDKVAALATRMVFTGSYENLYQLGIA